MSNPVAAPSTPREALVLDGDEVVAVRRGHVGTFPSQQQPPAGADPQAWVAQMNARRGVDGDTAAEMLRCSQAGW